MLSIQPAPLHKVDIFYTIRFEALAKKYPHLVSALLGGLFIGSPSGILRSVHPELRNEGRILFRHGRFQAKHVYRCPGRVSLFCDVSNHWP
ncbi:hypothetical protein TRIP_B50203 [uncultured Desulfatiglans sp.]|uniref:Uncharacterized protein n=1 Tax=Uncultured Desulfatiglans sp. TaxID=1748965 RepID=A0A653AGQ2_UNCDX|nr:hypothetical protein TRIP_B50203 [uncultured Desulfatiglans sp.]